MYIISDLHANIEQLNKLLDLLKPAKEDFLIFLGDYIDKKIHTGETLQILELLKNETNCIFIKGDHEFVWERYLDYAETFRKDFLLKYGSVEALRQYTEKPEQLIERDDIVTIKKFLQPYLNFIKNTKDYYLVDKYLALHAGLQKEQLFQNPIQFSETNYFLRREAMNLEKLYLDKYIIVAGHTYFCKEPFIQKGYIGIDLGAGYDGYLGALDLKNNKVIRSDGRIFNLNKKI
jgi:serine/threonine protein phosphatase 1